MSATRLAYERIRGRNTMHFEEYFQCRHQGCMGVASRFLVYWMADSLLAAASCPKFRLRWQRDEARRELVRSI